VDRPLHVVPELAGVHHGDFAGLTNEQLAAAHPAAARTRAADKYRWRFPNGESYADGCGCGTSWPSRRPWH
jgi:probable phosphoglycerate mutase